MIDLNKVLKNFGPNLKLLRKEKRLTMRQLSETSGISQPNLSLIENGERDVALSTVIKLANSFEISIEDLLDTQSDQRGRLELEDIERELKTLINRVELLKENKEGWSK